MIVRITLIVCAAIFGYQLIDQGSVLGLLGCAVCVGGLLVYNK